MLALWSFFFDREVGDEHAKKAPTTELLNVLASFVADPDPTVNLKINLDHTVLSSQGSV
jgi:hypothetical protein